AVEHKVIPHRSRFGLPRPQPGRTRHEVKLADSPRSDVPAEHALDEKLPGAHEGMILQITDLQQLTRRARNERKAGGDRRAVDPKLMELSTCCVAPPTV